MLPFLIEQSATTGVHWLRYPDMTNPTRTATKEEIAMWGLLQGLEDATKPDAVVAEKKTSKK